MHEKVTRTEVIFDGRIVHLRVHDVELPNGEMSKREVVEHPGAVALVVLDQDQRVMLVRQYRLPADAITYELPAGTLEPGEAPETTAARELQEETGYRPSKLESLGGLYTAPGYTTEYIHLYYVNDVVEDPLDKDIDEFVEMEFVSLKRALEMVESGEISDAKTVIGLLRIARRLGV